jgi:capsule polysaccharide export protein KpsE/RkpR
MEQQGINLAVAKPQDKDAEIAKLREENQRLQAKRDNDERSAFGRLAAEAELRKQREQELADANRRLAEIQAKNARGVLTPEQIEALGQTGAEGVERMIEAKMAPFSAVPPAQADMAPFVSRLEAVEQMQRQAVQRQAYNANLVSWAAQSGSPNLFARLAPGGDLADKWASFAQQTPAAVTAYESGDTEATKAYVKLFLYENPGISQQAATPSAAGGFAAPADPNQYSPQTWLTETNALDARLSSGQIKKAEYDRGYAEANAKLAALQTQTR